MVKKNPSFKVGSVDGRKSLRVSELFKCPRAIQYEFLNFQKDPDKYETVRGKWLHLLFEEYLQIDPSVYQSYFLKKMLKYVDVSYPDPYVKKRLIEDMLAYEVKIKAFLLNTKRGKDLSKNAHKFEIEETMRIPVEELGLNLPVPVEIQKKYCLSGKPDFKYKNQIVEIKGRKELAANQKMQAYTYSFMSDIFEPTVKHGSIYLLLGDKSIRVVRNPFHTWRPWRRDPKQELANQIIGLIWNFEKIEANKEMLEPQRSGDCQFCNYWTSCLTIKKPRTDWRVIYKKK